MIFSEKYDRMLTGISSGIILPLIVGLTIYLVSSGHLSISSYLSRIAQSNIMTHAITLCVFPNVVIFMIFNRYDMMRACRGVLAVTIAWAIIVLAVKLLA